MEKASPRVLHLYLSLAELIGFLVLDAILNGLERLQKFASQFFLIRFTSSRVHNEGCNKFATKKATEDQELGREDVEIVMERIGLPITVNELTSLNEFSTVFEENEPSLEEVKEAFRVFDENCDGFLDAIELQRVLCKLGFKEGVDLDACGRMIAAHDQNQDGRIDFQEFVKFMESCLC